MKSEEYFEKIKEPLEKVLRVLNKDRGKLQYGQPRESITAQSLDSAIGNHMCDDHPEWFGITELEGHKIREYFQTNGIYYGWRDYIIFLHRNFPDLMDEEDPDYIKQTNYERKRQGLPLIKL